MAEKGLLRPVKQKKQHTTNVEHSYPRFPNRIKASEFGKARASMEERYYHHSLAGCFYLSGKHKGCLCPSTAKKVSHPVLWSNSDIDSFARRVEKPVYLKSVTAFKMPRML